VADDEDLAGRARELLADLTDFDERKMFGGLAVKVNPPHGVRQRPQ
jgi:hypothetical protein